MRTATISLRTDPETKRRLARAAALEWRTLTDFVLYYCEEAAHAALAKEQARKAPFYSLPLRRKRKVVKG